MKVCILGNSHAAALKLAWTRMGPMRPDITVDFFADRGQGLQALNVDGGVLVPGNEDLRRALAFTSGGKSQIDPAAYDVILLYGLGARPNFVHAGVFYSRQARQLALADLVGGTVSFELLQKLRSISTTPIRVGHNPLRAAQTEAARHFPAAYVAGIKVLNEEVYAPLQAQMVEQPRETIVGGRFTDPRFSTGSRRLAIGERNDDGLHPANDNVHMNDAFGALWLETWLAKLG